jgi:hypothetical protein
MEQIRRALRGHAEQTASAGGQLVGGSLPIRGGRSGRREERGGKYTTRLAPAAIRTTADEHTIGQDGYLLYL